jgi:hypothetical protein
MSNFSATCERDGAVVLAPWQVTVVQIHPFGDRRRTSMYRYACPHCDRITTGHLTDRRANELLAAGANFAAPVVCTPDPGADPLAPLISYDDILDMHIALEALHTHVHAHPCIPF